MKTLLFSILLLSMVTGFAWANGKGDAYRLTVDTPPAKAPKTDSKRSGISDPDATAILAEDDHYIRRDYYFMAEAPLAQEDYIYISLSKMVTPPSEQTKGEAKFLKIGDGREVWSKNYWNSRIARKNELLLGTVVVIFEGNKHNDIYNAPEDKKSARSGSWLMARVTDTNGLYKGYVAVSGGYKVSPDNLRVVMK
jgi:hypothetical protein